MTINSKSKTTVDNLLTANDTTETDFKTGIQDVTTELDNLSDLNTTVSSNTTRITTLENATSSVDFGDIQNDTNVGGANVKIDSSLHGWTAPITIEQVNSGSKYTGIVSANTQGHYAGLFSNFGTTNSAFIATNVTTSGFTANNTAAELGFHNKAGAFQHLSSGNAIDLATPDYAYLTSGGASGTFTGAHDALLPRVMENFIAQGDIVVDVNVIAKKNVNDTITSVTQSSEANQKSCLGVYSKHSSSSHVCPALSDSEGNLDSQHESLYETYDNVVINSLGEGLINVCDEGGNIEVGDLIVTSSVAGKGMKQSDDIIRNYTVAKAREAVTFDSENTTAQIACIYLCG